MARCIDCVFMINGTCSRYYLMLSESELKVKRICGIYMCKYTAFEELALSLKDFKKAIIKHHPFFKFCRWLLDKINK